MGRGRQRTAMADGWTRILDRQIAAERMQDAPAVQPSEHVSASWCVHGWRCVACSDMTSTDGGNGEALGRTVSPVEQVEAGEITPAIFTRFWKRVDTSAGVNGCWRRRGASNRGYAMFYFDTARRLRGSRFAFLSIYGEPPPHLPWVLHKCPGGSNRWCVNPAHLAPGDAQENVDDTAREGRTARGERSGWYTRPEAMARGERTGAYTHPERMPRGEQHGNAKLTVVAVDAIRAALAAGTSTRTLARRHGVCQTTIRNISEGKTWRSVAVSPGATRD